MYTGCMCVSHCRWVMHIIKWCTYLIIFKAIVNMIHACIIFSGKCFQIYFNLILMQFVSHIHNWTIPVVCEIHYLRVTYLLPPAAVLSKSMRKNATLYQLPKEFPNFISHPGKWTYYTPHSQTQPLSWLLCNYTTHEHRT